MSDTSLAPRDRISSRESCAKGDRSDTRLLSSQSSLRFVNLTRGDRSDTLLMVNCNLLRFTNPAKGDRSDTRLTASSSHSRFVNPARGDRSELVIPKVEFREIGGKLKTG